MSDGEPGSYGLSEYQRGDFEHPEIRGIQFPDQNTGGQHAQYHLIGREFRQHRREL